MALNAGVSKPSFIDDVSRMFFLSPNKNSQKNFVYENWHFTYISHINIRFQIKTIVICLQKVKEATVVHIRISLWTHFGLFIYDLLQPCYRRSIHSLALSLCNNKSLVKQDSSKPFFQHYRSKPSQSRHIAASRFFMQCRLVKQDQSKPTHSGHIARSPCMIQ